MFTRQGKKDVAPLQAEWLSAEWKEQFRHIPLTIIPLPFLPAFHPPSSILALAQFAIPGGGENH
jgi:hypothetical protein